MANLAWAQVTQVAQVTLAWEAQVMEGTGWVDRVMETGWTDRVMESGAYMDAVIQRRSGEASTH